MKYDLIVIGAGPAGLTAARESAKLGLKTVLVEKKQKPTQIKRLCSQLMKMGDSGFASAFVPTDKPISAATCTIETGLKTSKILIHNPEVEVNYTGELHHFHNAMWVSPGGASFTLFPSNEWNYGYLLDKEALLDGLLNECLDLGVTLIAGTKCTDVDNRDDGVTCALVPVQGDGTTQTIEARRCMLADGAFSPIMEKLGYNEGRTGPPALKFLSCALDRIDTPYSDSQHIYVALPSQHHGYFLVSHWPHGLYHIQVETMINSPANLVAIIDKFMHDSPFASWFKNSKIVSRITCNMALQTNIWNPASGSMICIGDNAAYAETAIKGAIAGGFKAAQATKMAIEGKDGNDYYNKYWELAFPSHSMQYRGQTRRNLSPAAVLNDGEMDTLYKWIADHDFHALINDVVGSNLKLIEAELPDIYAKVRIPVAPK
jgi:flavin-dependent dehydrogenase